MKTHKQFLGRVFFAVVLLSFVLSSHADLPRESICYNADLDDLSIGVNFDREERLLTQSGSGPLSGIFNADSIYAVVGYDVNPWFSVSGGLGQSEAKPEATGSSADPSEEKTMFMLGAQANIWQGMIFEPDYLTSRCRIQASFSFWKRDSSVYEMPVNWDEVRADLLFSIESFVTGLGEDKTETPYSLILVGGVVYSSMSLDGTLTGITPNQQLTFTEEEATGFMAGAKLMIHHNLSLGYEARIYEEISHTASVTYHF